MQNLVTMQAVELTNAANQSFLRHIAYDLQPEVRDYLDIIAA